MSVLNEIPVYDPGSRRTYTLDTMTPIYLMGSDECLRRVSYAGREVKRLETVRLVNALSEIALTLQIGLSELYKADRRDSYGYERLQAELRILQQGKEVKP